MHWISLYYKTFSYGKDPRLTAARPDVSDYALKGHVTSEKFVKGAIYQCVLGNVGLRSSPDPSSRQLSELLFGEHFLVLEENEGWAWGQTQYDKYVGYIPLFALKPLSHNVHSRVSNPLTWVYSEADLKSPPLRRLPMGAYLPAPYSPTIKGFVQIPKIGWVWEKHLTPLTLNLDYMTLAEQFLNAPYLWGGRTAMGLDCSGLTQISLGMAGIPLPRDTDQQEIALGQGFNIPNWNKKDALCRGDIVFFPGHVGLMVDENNLLHSNATHMATTINPLEEVVKLVARETETPVTSVKRLSKKTK
jgi:hypothetical protein